MQRSKRIRLLLSCRNYNGARQVIPLAQEAMRLGAFEVFIVADSPGFHAVRKSGLEAIKANIDVVERRDTEAQVRARGQASALLQEIAPDALIASSSGPDGGIDEALVAVHGPESSFVLQDSWGDVNDVFGVAAGHYFVLDKAAAAATRKRVKGRILESWMPKYDAYACTDWLIERGQLRRERGVESAVPVISFFAQALWDEPGYEILVRQFIGTVAEMDGAPRLILRAHPEDVPATLGEALKCAAALGVDYTVSLEGAAEDAIAASDVVVSAYSTCCYDAIVMGARSARPLNSSIYFMTEPVWSHYRASTKLDYLPPVREGMALLASSADELSQQLRAALEPKRREHLWACAREGLPEPGNVARDILDCVAHSLGGATGGARSTAMQ